MPGLACFLLFVLSRCDPPGREELSKELKMKSLLVVWLAGLVWLAAVPSHAQRSAPATSQDLQRLQDALENLDDSLAALPADNPRSREFADRADELRDDVVYLKVQIRRHQRGRTEGLGASNAEVEDLRRSIVSLQRDVDAALNRRFDGEAVLAEGTEIQVRLDQPVSSRTARREDRVEASVAYPVQVDGRVVVPAGTRLRGIVREAEPAERPARGGRLELTFDSIYLDERTRTDIRTRVVSLKENLDVGGDTGRRAGIGAALGGVLGSILGGKKGALVGILVGGTGGIASSKGDDVELPAGTVLTVRLERSLALRR
jgi:hypothetical protein